MVATGCIMQDGGSRVRNAWFIGYVEVWLHSFLSSAVMKMCSKLYVLPP